VSGHPWRPKRPAWLIAAAAIVAVSGAAFVAAAWWHPWRPGRIGGLVFGIAAAVLFLNAALYPARRTWKARPWGTVQRWLQLHIYGSVIASWFVLLHMGFALPSGQIGWWLFGLSLWTTVSGLFGVMIQKRVPLTIARTLQVEAIYERIPDLVGRLVAKADDAAAGAADALERAYQSDWRPSLGTPAPAWAYVGDPVRECDRRLGPLRDFVRFVSSEDRARLENLERIVREKLELDAHLSLQRAMRAWLVLHVPPACALLGLLAVHIVAVLWF
jgi:hypothetical protein